MKTPKQIIEDALTVYRPIHIMIMVSGGHDSITNAHVCSSILNKLEIPFTIYHGDTTIGIPETQEYVKRICDLYNWDMVICKPPDPNDHYDAIVEKYGFPGPTKSSHQYMYRRLKERALRWYVTHRVKNKPVARENVLLLSGVRKDESAIRMGYEVEHTKDNSRCWANPIFHWSEEDCSRYMQLNEIPRNPVKEKICISGECLCGAFARNEEWMEIKACYPEVAARIEELQQKAAANGKPWHWASGPNEWKKQQKENKKMFMCVGCEKKYA